MIIVALVVVLSLGLAKFGTTREKAASKAIGILGEILEREGPDATFEFMLSQEDLMKKTFTMDLVRPEGPLHHEYLAFMKKLQKQFEEKHPEMKKFKKQTIHLSSGVSLDPYNIEGLKNHIRNLK